MDNKFYLCRSQTLHDPLDDEDDDRNDRAIAEDCRHIQQAMTIVLPSISTGDEELLPFGYGESEPNFAELNLDALVTMRFQHQTEQAAKGIRLKGSSDKPADGEKEISIRRQLIRKFHEVLRQQQERGVGTGCDRAARWLDAAAEPGGQVSDKATGNSANAALAATAVATRVFL